MPSTSSVLFVALGLGAEASRIVLNTNSTPTAVNRWGNPDCPCIGIDEIEGHTTTIVNAKHVDFPADLGAHCEAWDEKSNPACPGQDWCKEKWCYVDPCKCKNVAALPKPSVYIPGALYQGKPVHFSYATCGNTDKYSKAEAKQTKKDIADTCSLSVKASKWGSENCRCVGIGGQTGTTKVTINGKQAEFPADVGAYCNTWESGLHPDCGSNSTHAFCGQSWCYVDPCTCTLPTPPKLSSYVPDALYQGKPVYYSYTACGGTDEYTAGVKTACVTQADEKACAKLEKCAWNGGMCLGKELVKVCHKSGAWNPQVLAALLLPLFGLVF